MQINYIDHASCVCCLMMAYKVNVFCLMFSMVRSSLLSAGVINSCAQPDVSDGGSGKVVDCRNDSAEKHVSGSGQLNDSDTALSSSTDKHNNVSSLKSPQIKVTLI